MIWAARVSLEAGLDVRVVLAAITWNVKKIWTVYVKLQKYAYIRNDVRLHIHIIYIDISPVVLTKWGSLRLAPTRSEARFARLLLDCELSYCFHWVIQFVVVGGRVHEWCKKGSGIKGHIL